MNVRSGKHDLREISIFINSSNVTHNSYFQGGHRSDWVGRHGSKPDPEYE